MAEKTLYCIGGVIPKDLPELYFILFNFISICTEKKTKKNVVLAYFYLFLFLYNIIVLFVFIYFWVRFRTLLLIYLSVRL